jgi:hypothetical protein
MRRKKITIYPENPELPSTDMKSASQKEIILVALGGNALIREGQAGTIEEQLENLRIPYDR